MLNITEQLPEYQSEMERNKLNLQTELYISIYLRRQQERGLMQKARRLMDENSVSFQMFIIILSSITLGSESQISVFKQCQGNT